MHLILCVNPAPSFTRVGLFEGTALRASETLRHDEAELAAFPRVADQIGLRLEAVRRFVGEAQLRRGALAAVAGRGGLLRSVPSGTYLVDAALLRDATRAERGEHAANLGGPLASAMAHEHGCPAFVVDPVSVDELEPLARLTGIAGVERRSLSHALHIRAVARRFARERGRPLAELGLVVAHLGNGTSMAALRNGRMVDVVNPEDEGPLSSDLAGGLPLVAVMAMCFAPGADRASVERKLLFEGGLLSHLGVRDGAEAARMAEAGDARARLVLEAMSYQAAKGIAAMAVALAGRVDAILLTGGMVRAKSIASAVQERVEWIAPVCLVPGEDELLALAEGAERVLSGEEEPRRYGAS